MTTKFTMDNFVGNLRCPNCGVISQADESTNMVTYIRSKPEMTYLGTGHPLQINMDRIEESGYLIIKIPQMNEDVHILHAWGCPACGTWPHWAEIVVINDEIRSISPVRLDRKVFERANLIDYEVKASAAELIGKSYVDLAYDEVVPILRNFFNSSTSDDLTID